MLKMTRREMGRNALTAAGAVFLAKITGRAAAPGLEIKAPTPGANPPATKEGLTRYIAEFVVKTGYSDIPEDVIELGKKSILDGLGLALAGSVVESGNLCRKYIGSLRLQPGGATVIGSNLKVSPRFAAFANGVGIHSEDFDDTQLAVGPGRVYGMLTHPTAPVLPAALAFGETKSISGRDLMLAYQLGVEVETKICEAVNPRLYLGGFHSTGTVGTFGAATAAAKLHNLDAHWITDAYGIAGAEAAGLQASLGTMTKPFQAGHAAESGIVAADLASLGWTASLKVLEDPGGFFHAFGGGYDASYIVGKLGNPWTFASPGVSIKPFPCGSLAHPGMDEFLSLIEKNHIQPDQVESVTVGVNRAVPKALFYHDPHTGLQGKFSMEFCIASLLLYRKAGLSQFQNDVVDRPEVQNMIKRVHLVIDPRANAAGLNKMRTYITIKLKSGQTLTGFADYAKGSPAHPMSYDEVADKFLGCADFAKWPRDKAKAVIEMVRSLENVSNVGELTALLST